MALIAWPHVILEWSLSMETSANFVTILARLVLPQTLLSAHPVLPLTIYTCLTGFAISTVLQLTSKISHLPLAYLASRLAINVFHFLFV
jgi:hypothetical protein